MSIRYYINIVEQNHPPAAPGLDAAHHDDWDEAQRMMDYIRAYEHGRRAADPEIFSAEVEDLLALAVRNRSFRLGPQIMDFLDENKDKTWMESYRNWVVNIKAKYFRS